MNVIRGSDKKDGWQEAGGRQGHVVLNAAPGGVQCLRVSVAVTVMHCADGTNVPPEETSPEPCALYGGTRTINGAEEMSEQRGALYWFLHEIPAGRLHTLSHIRPPLFGAGVCFSGCIRLSCVPGLGK